MPTLAELAQMGDGGNSGAYVGYPQLQRQANKMRLAQMGRIPENLADPRTYGFVSGLMGTSPDQLGMSVLSPNTAPAKEAAYTGYQLSNLGQIAPAMMPASKVLLRTAGNAVNDAMVYGTGPLARITPQPMRLTTYHGTPHSFDKFDASKIGTGEGAQAYGHGIYVAENPEVARGYANRLGANLVMVDGKPMDFNDPVHIAASIISDPNNAGLPGKQLASAIRYDPKGIVPYGTESKVEEIAKALESGNLPKYTNEKGNFYKAELPDKMIPTMLDWDEHLSKQSPEIQRILYPYQKKLGTSFGTGEQILKEIAFDRRMKGLDDSPAAVSKQLQEMGITGVKYLDEGSRRPGVSSMTQSQLDTRIDILKKDIDSGLGNQDRMKQILSALEKERAAHTNITRNFVVFPGNEHMLKIETRNGQPIK